MSAPAIKPLVQETESLRRAGIGNDVIEAWHATAPADTDDFSGDCIRYSRFWQTSAQILARLPAKTSRDVSQTEAAEQLKRVSRDARTAFLRAHSTAVYEKLTRNRTQF
ncbi:MAG TPA: hypothetical protein VIU02_13055, partial [Burkholderiales bacterium]